MKYLLLVAHLALAGTERVPSKLIDWCKSADSTPTEEGRVYARTITIDKKDMKVFYEDNNNQGRSDTDVLRIE